MPDCATCRLFEAEYDSCLHINRPGGLDLTRQMIASAGLLRGDTVLEMAAGAGASLNMLASEYGLATVGLDLSPRMLHLAHQKYPHLTLLQADAAAIPLPSSTCQAVLTECAFSMIHQNPSLLKEVLRVLAPGGRLLVTDLYLREVSDPAGRADLSASPCLSGVMTEPEIRVLLTEFGLVLRDWQDRTRFLKSWLGRLVFQLGSLAEVYRRLAGCEADGCRLASALGTKLKLGYYSLMAVKPAT